MLGSSMAADTITSEGWWAGHHGIDFGLCCRGIGC